MRKKPTKEHWTDRHGFVLSAASAGLLAWALMSIWQTVRQCAARMMGIVTKNRGALTILSIDGLSEKLDALLTREEKQSK